MSQPKLFEVDATEPSARVKLTEFKHANKIQTHHAKHMRREDEPWMAVILFAEDEGKSIGEVMAQSCGLYDESGYCATGTGELSAVRALCQRRAIACPL